MTARQSQSLPYLQNNHVGRLNYVRRIPARRADFSGSSRILGRWLGLMSTDQADPAVIRDLCTPAVSELLIEWLSEPLAQNHAE